jgi:RNA 3'-phosphate cyclase
MSKQQPITIDGSYGEGGGQIIRTSLSLAMITGRPLRLVNIRKGRKKPGLRPQHLTAVNACTSISRAIVNNAQLGALEFSFSPESIHPGTYQIHIGTAGSAPLVLQTVLPPLSQTEEESHLLISGGTHVPWSPPFHYLEQVFFPTVERLGYKCKASLSRWGWYPKGGGEIKATIRPAGDSVPGALVHPFEPERVTAISASSRLPEHIRVRQKRQLQKRLGKKGIEAEIALMDPPALCPGSFVFVCAGGKTSMAGFSALGARGKPAELVADEAASALLDFLDTRSNLDHHLADQILIYLALTAGQHEFTTSAVTSHLLTNAWVIEQFLPVQFDISGKLDKPGQIVKRDS